MCRAEARVGVYLCVHVCIHYIHGHNVHRIYRSPQRQVQEESREKMPQIPKRAKAA